MGCVKVELGFNLVVEYVCLNMISMGLFGVLNY